MLKKSEKEIMKEHVKDLENMISKGILINIEYSKDNIPTVLHTYSKDKKELFISTIIDAKDCKTGADINTEEELNKIEHVPLVRMKFYKNESIDALIRILERIKE